jgi:TolB-like protein/DNA-binding winged helix-turn-helix (wHTH) protein/Tfp pilus assembly protein PilF
VSSAPTPVQLVYFADFEVDIPARELRRNGARVRLPDQSFEVLLMLLERPRELVTRSKLRQRLWPNDAFGDFDHGLNNAVNRLREALGDSAESPTYIETLPRRGYRLITPVRNGHPAVELTRDRPEPKLSLPDQTDSRKFFQRNAAVGLHIDRKRFWVLVLISTALLVGAVGLALWRRNSGFDERVIHSLVVLPLENLSRDPGQEYFADGMTDALITNLAGIDSLRVISRTSAMHYKGSRTTLSQIAHELNVDAVVEGTVSRDEHRIRINVQLIDARTDRHLWAMAFDGEPSDVLSLQAGVATAISDQIATRLAGGHRRSSATNRKIAPEAYEHYLRGRYAATHGAFTPEGWKEARTHFSAAIQLEPEYTDAIVGLAYTYVIDDPTTARLLALKALELDATSTEAHLIVANVIYRRDWRFQAAEKEFQNALRVDPNSVVAHREYGVFLAQMGRFPEALAELTNTAQLDPLSPESYSDLGLLFYLWHRHDESIAHLKHALSLDPNFQMASRHLLRIHETRNEIPQYIDTFAKASSWFNVTPAQAADLAQEWRQQYRRGGAPAFWRARLRFELQRRPLAHPFGLARIYAQLGDTPKAVAQLQEAYDQRDSLLVSWMKTDPQFDSLRSDPRFQALLNKIGYPQ